MRRSPRAWVLRCAPLVLLATAAAAQRTAPHRSAKRMDPFEIRLTVAPGPRLRAVLRNRSTSPQLYAHDNALQPSSLEITRAGGDTVAPFDSRTIKKFDTTVRRSLFRKLGPGVEAQLDEVTVRRDGEGYQIRWGPFEYNALPPGTYTVRVVWTSELREFTDTTRQSHPLDGIWLGTLRSNAVEVTLP